MSAGRQILFLALFMVFGCQMRTVTAEEEAKCECGIFKFIENNEKITENPLFSKTPEIKFECNDEGIQTCANTCKALAEVSRPEAKEKICKAIENSEEPYVPGVYYKACGADAWTYSGMKPTIKACCKDKNVIPCEDEKN